MSADSRVTAADWQRPAALPALGDAEVHVWRASIAGSLWLRDRRDDLLDAAERARHERFHRARDRDRFAVAHAMRRLLLAHYGQRAPHELVFAHGPQGKPHLANARRPVEFNMSDSGDTVLLAASGGAAVGVDVEVWTPGMDDAECIETAVTAFSASERDALEAAPPTERRRIFFSTWSRKEAYLKATGEGVTGGLDHFDVSAEAHAPRLLAHRREAREVTRWGMLALDLGAEVAGALVWDREVTAAPRVRLFDVHPALFPPGA